MNRWEKEVQRSLLDSEEAVIKELEKQYTRALNDINEKVKLFQADIDLLDEALSQDGLDDATKTLLQSQKRSKIYQQQYQQALKGQVSAIVDKLHGDSYATIDSYLKSCYETGYVGTMYDVAKQGVPIITPIDQAAAVKAVLTDSKVSEGYYNHLGVNYSRLKKTITQEISRGIASSLPYRDIARNINNVSQSGLNNAKRIARTEGHRIQQTSTRDAQLAAKAKGADVVKQWDAALDGRTRDSHRRVDGEIRELDEKFSNGLMFPGDPSGRAEEVINCRCTSDTRARWALDESELQTLQERAEYFGIDKTENFEEFREKYLTASNEIADNPPVVVGGVDCVVSEKKYGFGNGTETGVKKTTDAVTYTTPDGTSFVFPKGYNRKQQTMTADQAISCWQQVPANIREQAQKTIEFVDYYNPQDSYWRTVYKNFPHSYATGGSKITFYRHERPHNSDYVVRTYCHEAGHLIDINQGTNGRFSSESLWTKAMADDIVVSGKKSCTAYGENSPTEDFAESVAEYVKDKTGFESIYPNRAAILATIISI